MDLRYSYTILAPFYDRAIARPSAPLRRASLARLSAKGQVLVAGIGSGLDIPYLPPGPCYVGMDLTFAMLRRAKVRTQGRDDVLLHLGDVSAMPYADRSFDTVVMHLILAVVPRPERALAEAARVLRPGGRILILDKFLRPDQRAPLRRLLNGVSRHVATRTDVVFEQVLRCCPDLRVKSDRPALMRGWFRYIELVKEA